MNQKILTATHGSDKTPLKIGDKEYPCYVLEDGTAVLSTRAVQGAIGFPATASGLSLGKLINNKRLRDYVTPELRTALDSPIKFKRPGAGGAAPPLTHGYEATILIDICYVLIDAKNAKAPLTPNELLLEMQAQIIIRAFSKMGIIAVIYNVTGYQDQVVMGALNEMLNKILLMEAKKYVVTFPIEFYKQVFRLNNWEWKKENAQKKPGVLGNWTRDLIYKRMAPGLLKELERRNPKNEKGYRDHKHFQFLTDEVGEPRLREFFGGLLALARANTSWRKFYDMVERAFPRYNDDGSQTQEFPFPLDD